MASGSIELWSFPSKRSSLGRMAILTFAAPAIVGGCVGAAVVLDPLMSFGWGAGLGGRLGLLSAAPFLFSAGMALGLCLACAIPWIRDKNGVDRFLLFLLVASVFLTGIPLFFGLFSLVAAYLLIFFRTTAGERCEVVWTPIYLFVLAFASATILSLIPLGDLVFWALVAFRRFVHIALLLLLVNTIRTPAQLRRCVTIVCAVGVLSAIIGIGQVVAFLRSGLLLFPTQAIFWSTPWGAIPRAVGLFDHPNALGGTLAWVGVCLAFLGVGGAGIFGARERVVFLGGSLTVFIGQFLSGSRGSWLASAVIVALLPMLQRPARGLHYLVGVSIAAAASYVSGLAPFLWEQAVRLNPVSVDFRQHIADLAWEAIRQYPLLGVGIDNLTTYNNPFRLPAHNLFLQMATDFGLPMACVSLLFLASMFVRGVLAARAAHGKKEGLLLQGILLGFAAVFIHSQADLYIYSRFFWFQLALLECAILICSQEAAPHPIRPIFGR